MLLREEGATVDSREIYALHFRNKKYTKSCVCVDADTKEFHPNFQSGVIEIRGDVAHAARCGSTNRALPL